MLERIEAQGQLFAIVLRSGHVGHGAEFFSLPEYPLQLGLLQHAGGTVIRAHVHHRIDRRIVELQEVLHIEQGHIEASFFDAGGREATRCLLNEGDTILLVSGGHGFKVLDDARILEVKQGPYEGPDKDKAYI